VWAEHGIDADLHPAVAAKTPGVMGQHVLIKALTREDRRR
jgi:hypothetical protein